MSDNLLFVCTGNTCRSVMAQALYNGLAVKRGLFSRAKSAGINAGKDGGPSAGARAAMLKYGIDISAHRPAQVTDGHIKDADIVLCMERRHASGLQAIYPEYAGKIYCLKEYALGIDGDVQDPYGGGVLVYEKCAQELLSAVNALLGGRER